MSCENEGRRFGSLQTEQIWISQAQLWYKSSCSGSISKKLGSLQTPYFCLKSVELTFANNHVLSQQPLDPCPLEFQDAYFGIQPLLQPALDSILSMGRSK